ncbi:DUF2079 domain-containing protein [Candidatus Woesearchaeota archaeon]|nr:MAG: DUF2079 domain-containing protein [Candidatus Woesearchaeota archaeon]
MEELKKIFQENKEIIIIVAIFLALRIASMFRYHIPIWDEAVYYGMGKYLYSLGSMGLWEDIRPIVLPLILGFFWKINMPWALTEIVPVFFSTATLLMTYILGKKLFNKDVGALAAFLLAITPIFHLYTPYYLTEIPATFFSLLALYWFLEARYFLSGIAAGVAFLTKFYVGLIVVSIGLLIISQAFQKTKKAILRNIMKTGLLFCLGFFILFFLFGLFNYFMYPRENFAHSAFHTFIMAFPHQANPFETIAMTDTASTLFNIFYYPLELFKSNYIILAAIPALFFLLRKKHLEKTLPVLLPLLIGIAYLSVIPNKQLRFAIMVVPFLCMLVSVGMLRIVQQLKKRTVVKATVVIIFSMLIMANLITLSGYFFWKPATQPLVVQELYSNLPQGTVLTSDPVFSVYNNNRFIPYYYSAEAAEKIFQEELKKTSIIIYDDRSLTCYGEDPACTGKVADVKAIIGQHVLFKKYEYQSNTYYLYTV